MTTVTKLAGQPGDVLGSPDGPSFDAQGNLYFTTMAEGGLWRLTDADPEKEPVQITPPFGNVPGFFIGAVTAVLPNGPYSGDIIMSRRGGNVVYKISLVDCPSTGSTNCAQPKVFLEKNLSQPVGLAINSRGEIFVGSSSSTRTVGQGWVTQFASDGSFIGEFVDLGNSEGNSITFDSQDNLWAVTANAVFKITPSGEKTLVTSVPFEGVGIAICKDSTATSANPATTSPHFPVELTSLWLALGLYAFGRRKVSQDP